MFADACPAEAGEHLGPDALMMLLVGLDRRGVGL